MYENNVTTPEKAFDNLIEAAEEYDRAVGTEEIPSAGRSFDKKSFIEGGLTAIACVIAWKYAVKPIVKKLRKKKAAPAPKSDDYDFEDDDAFFEDDDDDEDDYKDSDSEENEN